MAVTGEGAITSPGSVGLGAAWWHRSLHIAGANPAMLFCRSSPTQLQELPADLDIFVNIALLFSSSVFFFVLVWACYTITMCIYFYSRYFLLKLCKLFKSLWHFHGRVDSGGGVCVWGV